jgi:hypothetical protein
MTPKEKAKELVDKMYSYTPVRANLTLIEEDKNTAKQCALIAVDEILNDCNVHLHLHQIEYWKKVKRQIKRI